ncbi:MAG: hypothetical protein ACK4QP_12415 [Pseudorhizobium sp.]
MRQSPTVRKSVISGRVEVEHGPYRIIAGDVGEICKAVAYLGMGGMQPIEAVEGATVEAAVAAMIEVLDAHLAELHRQRRDGVPGSGEYLCALAMLPSKMQTFATSMTAVAARPAGYSLTLSELEQELRSASPDVLGELQRLGRKLGAFLEYEPDWGSVGKGLAPFLTFSKIESAGNDDAIRITFHPEFCQALMDLPKRRAPKVSIAGRR